MALLSPIAFLVGIIAAMTGVGSGVFLVFVALRIAFQFNLYRVQILRIGKIWHRKILDSDGTIY